MDLIAESSILCNYNPNGFDNFMEQSFQVMSQSLTLSYINLFDRDVSLIVLSLMHSFIEND